MNVTTPVPAAVVMTVKEVVRTVRHAEKETVQVNDLNVRFSWFLTYCNSLCRREWYLQFIYKITTVLTHFQWTESGVRGAAGVPVQ